MLSESNTDLESLGTERFDGEDTLECLFPDLNALLQDAMERTGAVRGTLEAYGVSLTQRAEASRTAVAAPRLIAATAAVQAGSVSGRAVGGKVSVDTRLGARLETRLETRLGTSLETRPPVPVSASTRRQTIHLVYQGRQTGCLSLDMPVISAQMQRREERETLGRELGFRMARAEIRNWARCALGLEIPLVGTSPSMALLESEIAKVAAVHYPVVLESEAGSDEVEFAAAIHGASLRRSQPFVVLNCSSSGIDAFELRLHSAWTRAMDGSLFIANLDLLDMAAQRQLLHYLSQDRRSRGTVRILVSSGAPLSQLAREGKISRQLRSELDVLQLRLPPLRERREDLAALLEHCFRKHDLPERRFSAAAWQCCLDYDWPENEAELENFAIRVAVMTETPALDIADLQAVAPWLPGERAQPVAAEADCWSAPMADEICEENEEPTPSQRQWLEVLARKLVAREYETLSTLCSGMQRALRYVSEHFQDEISLGQLSREAFISVSHLSFLFKRDIGVPFKTLLASVRVEKACQLLLANSQQSITEISLDAGFGDLSHFERTFKRLVGTNPRDYRRQQLHTSLKASSL